MTIDATSSTAAQLDKKPLSLSGAKPKVGNEQDWERDYRFIEKHKLTEDAPEVYVNTNSIVPEAKPLDPLFKKLMFSQ